MRPAIDGDAGDIPGRIETARAQHAAQLIAQVTLEGFERRLEQKLIARVRSVLRRAGRSAGPGRVEWKDLSADPDSRKAHRGDRELHLTRREFDLLIFFLRYPGRTWTRDQILDRVWGASYEGDSRTVDLHIRRLRSKVEDDPSDPKYLATVWGVGYRLSEAS